VGQDSNPSGHKQLTCSLIMFREREDLDFCLRIGKIDTHVAGPQRFKMSSSHQFRSP
jgi:hypothetical protein